jgi:Ala-tRNA(Pro) deacylase
MSDVHAQLCALLDSHAAAYRVVEHAPEGRTEIIAALRGNRIEQSIKSMVVQVRLNRKDNRYALVNVPGNRRVDLAAVAAHFAAESAGFAARARAEELTGCVLGAIPPFAFSERLAVLADPSIQDNEEVVFNAGRLDRSIFMRSADYVRIARPALAAVAAPA